MPKAKYEGIYHSIKKRIEAQDYPYQSLLPSENTLNSRNTPAPATQFDAQLAELVADGYVQTMQGRGVRVIYQPVGKDDVYHRRHRDLSRDSPPQPSASRYPCHSV